MVNSSDIKNIFGYNLKKLRVERELTQEQLAEFLGLQVQSISFIENGRAFVSAEVLAKICNFFDVSLEVMFASRFLEKTVNAESLKKEIIQMMAGCDEKILTQYRNILFSLKS